ncbi:hypothetical protein FEZ51_02360 [Pediococcus stilesii]|uniref:Lipoprotein n=1 Tax=Pediococcus stilesii TaxID=331679 RepID=A0A5R9BWM7_9LACO|nr:hypothetical protein [Pediococcus stilesii]TLQ05104.1 hypothetical protein FEZ51_02360 [Pediococcus stilesii]
MKRFNIVFFIVAIVTLGGLLSACGVGKNSDSNTAASSSSEKTLDSYLQGVKDQGLTVDDQGEVEIADLSKQVKATSGVRFNGEGGAHAKLLKFDNEDLAQKASSFYASKQEQVHAEGNMLLVMDRSLQKDWFKKYQDAIFKQ